MARAVLDTSVLISAFLTPPGTPGSLLAAALRGDFVLCLSPEIVGETRTVLLREPKLQVRYGYAPIDVEAFLAGMLRVAEMVAPLPTLAGAVPLDPKDDAIVATAVAARADFLVTGDRCHLLALGTYQGIRIVTPRAFLDLLGGG